MTRTRFEQIAQCLACEDPDQSPDTIKDKAHRYLAKKAHPLYHIKTCWDEVIRNCQRRFHPGVDLALDVAMVR
jgi:hypothetical protein